MTDRSPDPCGAHRFRVDCDALPSLGFSEVRGLAVAVADREEGSTDRRPIRDRLDRVPHGSIPPARRETHSPALQLHRGVTDEQALWTWLQEWVAGEVEPQDVRICLLNAGGEPVRGWVCRAATPIRWTGPALVADRAAVATESLELVHEGIDALTDPVECAEQ